MKKRILISLKNIWKSYYLGSEVVNALRGINLDIFENSFVSISGPSGSGKSTLMSIVGCLDKPSKGSIFLEGRNIENLSDDRLSRLRGKKIGFVFQKFNLIANLSALQNVALPMAFQGVGQSTRQKRAFELLDFVGLGNRVYHKPNELSGGEQQRVAIARALSNDPEVILADEPTGNLDSSNGKKIMDFFKTLKNQGKTIIFVTHDNSLTKYADRIIRLMDGKVVEGLR